MVNRIILLLKKTIKYISIVYRCSRTIFPRIEAVQVRREEQDILGG
jgi:hypothetical protein